MTQRNPLPQDFPPGERVVIVAGPLEGTVGTVIRRSGSGSMLVGLHGNAGQIAIRLPEALLSREIDPGETDVCVPLPAVNELAGS